MKNISLYLLLSFLLTVVVNEFAIAQVNFTSSNLPIVVVNTYGQNIPDEGKIDVFMGIIYNEDGSRNYLSLNYNHFMGPVAIEVRGSSSQMFPKKSYGFETRDEAGNNLNVSLLGMPSENDWILYAPYTDKSMMRDVLAYQLSWKMGWYASRTRYCELVLNGEYNGVYVLMEKIKRDGGRVNIKKIDADDLAGDSLTGGYIVKIDKTTGTNYSGWTSPYQPYPGAWQSIYYQYHDPDGIEIQPQQAQYIQNYITAVEGKIYNMLGGNNFLMYDTIIEVNSFIDFLLSNELGKNVDGYRLSSYLYKDRNSEGGKLNAGPLWDFNLAYGNADYYNGWITSGWQYQLQNNDDGYANPFYWTKLMADTKFKELCVNRWNSLRQNGFSKDSINAFIDQTAALLEESQVRNYQKWPILGVYVWPNAYVGQTYADEINYLKTWISNRIDWLDEQLKPNPLINEIMYNPSSAFDSDEWIEIYNPAFSSWNISYWKLKDGNSGSNFVFPNNTVMPAKSYLAVCRNTSKFHQVYPGVSNYMGNFSFTLDNIGESLTLTRSDNTIVDHAIYGSQPPWPTSPNGQGPSLELKDAQLDNTSYINWKASNIQGGTPGSQNSPSLKPDVFINEFMADNLTTIQDEHGQYEDWIEIYNGTNQPFNIGGMYITDKLNIPNKYKIPENNPDSTTIQPGGFLILWADEDLTQGVLHVNIKLSKNGEQIGLFDADGITAIDSLTFGPQQTDVSLARITDGYPGWHLLNQPTPGYSNANSHEIIIPAGWSGISSFREPFENDIEIILANIQSEFVLITDMSKIYFPSQGINTLQTWDTHSGYKIKVDEPIALHIFGPVETNHTVLLNEGWNMMPVLSECDLVCDELFQQLGNHLIIACDIAGSQVYWPEMSITTLEFLVPGKAYFINVDQEISIEMSGCSKK